MPREVKGKGRGRLNDKGKEQGKEKEEECRDGNALWSADLKGCLNGKELRTQ